MTSVPDRHARHERVAQRVGAVALDHLERVDAVAERLGHLAMLGVADRAVQVHAGVRHLAHELEARHDHPRHPEEQDLGGGDQRVAGVERREIRASARASRGSRTARARRRTRCRARPRPAAPAPPHPGHAPTSVRLTAGAAAALVVAVPDRDAVAPPELAGDAPVADALQPLGVVVAPALGDEPERAVAVRRERRARERLHPDEPLVREPWLDDRVAAVAVADRVTVGLHLLEQARLASNSATTALARLVAVEPLEAVGRRQADARLGGHHVDASGRPCRRPISKSVGSCAGVTFTAPEPKAGSTASSATIGIAPVHQRQQQLAADQVPVALVLGMHRHGRCRPASSRAGSWRR